MRSFLTMATLAAACLGALAQTPPPQPSACSAPEHRQFDFWIGHWEVFTPDGKQAGENLIEASDGGCVLIERWRGGGGFSGTSLNSWDRDARLWRQHWVDSQGGLLRLAGRFEAGRMVLASAEPHPDRPGTTRRQRIAWAPLPDGAVRQHWEQSDDDGSTWTTLFDGRYVKAR
jgi:hypothetical protein